MIRNYFKIAIRNIARHKSFTILNVTGLAIGMAACILLFIVVRYEMSYDRFHPDGASIYHVVTQDKTDDGDFFNPGVPTPALEAFRADLPDYKTGALQDHSGSQITILGTDPNAPSTRKFIGENGLFFADPEFFSIFSFKWLIGSPAVLANPNVTVLTRKMADTYFGNWKEAIGQYIRLDNALTLKVEGVLEDIPSNSDFPLAVVTSLITSRNNPDYYNYSSEWGSLSSSFQVFMKLPPNVSGVQADKQLMALAKKYYPDRRNGVRFNFLQPLGEIHFDTRFGNMGDHSISKATLWTLTLIGVFIIIMACINFINLSTAQAVTRSKEIGIRKVLGSRRMNLFWQIMGETGIVVFIAVLLAIVLAMLSLPYISHVASIEEKLSLFTSETVLFIIITALLVTVFSGAYPALIVSGFRPLLALKNKITSASIGGLSLRRGLVVLQFTISQVLIIGTIVAITQMSFVKNADLGFNKEAVYVITANSDSTILSRQKALKQELLGMKGVKSVSFSSDVPSSENNWGTNFAFNNGSDEKYTLYLKYADADYFNTFGLDFAAGKGLSVSDTAREVVINETLARKLGLKDPSEAIGKVLRMGGGPWRPIAGVVKDFKINSLREETKPLMISSRQVFYNTTSIKLASADLQGAAKLIQNTWDKYNPEYANQAGFFDESINQFYEQENQLALLYKIFAAIAILISCLGLYGLVSFMAVQRVKEVGVRKVLGASVGNIIYLFSKEFTILILIAFALAAPLAWYLMNNWLGNFAYRAPVGAGIFVLAILSTICIAWITVGYKSVRAATANPVKSLRSE